MLCPNSEFPSSDAGHPGKRDQNSVMFLRKEVFNLDTITFLTDKVWEEFGDAKVGTIHVRFTVLYKGSRSRRGSVPHSLNPLSICLSVSPTPPSPTPSLHHPLAHPFRSRSQRGTSWQSASRTRVAKSSCSCRFTATPTVFLAWA